ncbi:MAG: DUF1634 domain-containing protein [Proteobacteria bacterium]|nr:MAG: DUF1634 domain-containing protein [Pseudomonadota bacterium]
MNAPEPMHRLELRIAYLLRYGVIIAGVSMFIGWAWSLAAHGDTLQTFQIYRPVSLFETWRAAHASADWGTLITTAGLGLLVLLPVVRVLLTGVLFAKQGDRVLAVVAFLVLAILLGSFSLGIDL